VARPSDFSSSQSILLYALTSASDSEAGSMTRYANRLSHVSLAANTYEERLLQFCLWRRHFGKPHFFSSWVWAPLREAVR
jgi:hypothetical protein